MGKGEREKGGCEGQIVDCSLATWRESLKVSFPEKLSVGELVFMALPTLACLGVRP